MFHAQGLRLASAPVASLVDGPAHDSGLGVTKNLNAAPLRPETSRVVKGTDHLADLASVTERCAARDSIHFIDSLMSDVPAKSKGTMASIVETSGSCP